VLRKTGAVTEVDLPGGKTAWAVTTFAAVRELLARPDISSDPRRGNFPDPFPDTDSGDTAEEEGEQTQLLIFGVHSLPVTW
jgi:hypothetical protein